VSESRRLTMIVYGMGVLLVLAGLTGISRVALRLEQNDREARAQAAFRETVQLALWRMESKLLPVINREIATPYFHYRPYYPAERAYTRMWEEVPPDAVLVPSPLLGEAGEFVRLHFEVDAEGNFSSPQVPTGNMRDQAEAGDPAMSQRIVEAESTLGTLVSFLAPGSKNQRLAELPSPHAQLDPDLLDPDLYNLGQLSEDELGLAQRFDLGPMKEIVPESDLAARQDVYEFAQRSNVRAQTAQTDSKAEAAKHSAPDPVDAGLARSEGEMRRATPDEEQTERAAGGTPETRIGAAMMPEPSDGLDQRGRRAGREGLADDMEVNRGPEVTSFRPVWRTGQTAASDQFTGQLLLLRSVRIGGEETTQGVWLDWPAIKSSLLDSVADILPGASLQPVYPGSSVEGVPAGQRLASVPAVFLPGAQPEINMSPLTTTTGSLAVTWLAVLAAVAAIGIVLRKSTELAERRGRFVTAVTHELRTPMTTFCLYTQMLADGMVQDESDRKGYLETLKRESTRLAGIVENVLDYARLGESRSHTRAAPCRLGERLASVEPTLQERAKAGEMQLTVAIPEDDLEVLADAKGLERILLNLVDNACKYAAEGGRIDVETTDGDRPSVRVRDYGPGIEPEEIDKVFRPFRRAARDADSPNPGLGLGLALCRGLARAMGGELTVEPAPNGPGAVFILEFAKPSSR